MPAAKVTFTFALDKYSWTESHWFLGTGAPTLNAIAGQGSLLALVRVPCLGVGCSLTKMRVSLSPANRQVLDFYPPFIVSQPTWPADPTGLQFNASRAFIALMGAIQALDGTERNYYVGGCPTSLIHSFAGDQLGVAWGTCPDMQPRAQALAGQLTNGNWGWATRRDSVMQQAQGLVTNALFPAMIGVVVPNQILNAVVGSTVLVRNFRRINVKQPKLSAIWQIGGILAPTAPATQWTYFLLNSGAVPLANYKGLGQIGLLSQTFRTYNVLQWVEATQRKRGATAGRPRGRLRSRI